MAWHDILLVAALIAGVTVAASAVVRMVWRVRGLWKIRKAGPRPLWRVKWGHEARPEAFAVRVAIAQLGAAASGQVMNNPQMLTERSELRGASYYLPPTA